MVGMCPRSRYLLERLNAVRDLPERLNAVPWKNVRTRPPAKRPCVRSRPEERHRSMTRCRSGAWNKNPIC